MVLLEVLQKDPLNHVVVGSHRTQDSQYNSMSAAKHSAKTGFQQWASYSIFSVPRNIRSNFVDRLSISSAFQRFFTNRLQTGSRRGLAFGMILRYFSLLSRKEIGLKFYCKSPSLWLKHSWRFDILPEIWVKGREHVRLDRDSELTRRCSVSTWKERR